MLLASKCVCAVSKPPTCVSTAHAFVRVSAQDRERYRRYDECCCDCTAGVVAAAVMAGRKPRTMGKSDSQSASSAPVTSDNDEGGWLTVVVLSWIVALVSKV